MTVSLCRILHLFVHFTNIYVSVVLMISVLLFVMSFGFPFTYGVSVILSKLLCCIRQIVVMCRLCVIYKHTCKLLIMICSLLGQILVDSTLIT